MRYEFRSWGVEISLMTVGKCDDKEGFVYFFVFVVFFFVVFVAFFLENIYFVFVAVVTVVVVVFFVCPLVVVFVVRFSERTFQSGLTVGSFVSFFK